jgi:tetratricopeptide (TPR) repeat protein
MMNEFIFYQLNEQILLAMNLPPHPFPVRQEMEYQIFGSDQIAFDMLLDELDLYLTENPEYRENYSDTIGLLSYIVGVQNGTEGKTLQAIHYFEMGLSYRPDNLSLRTNYAVALYSLNWYEEALDQYEYIMDDPDIGVSPLIWTLAARLYSDMGDYENSYQLLEECEPFFEPEDEFFWDFLIEIIEKLGTEETELPSENLILASEDVDEQSTAEKDILFEPPPAYCANCGAQIREGAKFCIQCGKQVIRR